MPREWRELLEELAPVFARRSTFRLFTVLACGLVLADRGTVTGMAAAAGIGREWRRACWFFASAKWDPDLRRISPRCSYATPSVRTSHYKTVQEPRPATLSPSNTQTREVKQVSANGELAC